MRAIPDSLAARLGGATTLCHCWRLVRRDGTRLGFTDHDRDLSFDGITHSAMSGLDAANVESVLGFAVGGGEVSGALSSTTLNETDLANGRFDAATLETWLVDWMQPEARLLLDIGTIGEVKRSDVAFAAEVRSFAHAFDEPHGRYFQSACSADLGDSRCGVDLTTADMRRAGSVVGLDGSAIVVALSAVPDGWFSGGALFSGAERLATIRDHEQRGDHARVTLWTPLPAPPATGVTVTLVAGCDKHFATCRAKFANSVNFRGFPHIPGNDLILSYVQSGSMIMDGGSLFK